MERDDLHRDPEEELDEYEEESAWEQEEFDAEPLRLVDKLLSKSLP